MSTFARNASASREPRPSGGYTRRLVGQRSITQPEAPWLSPGMRLSDGLTATAACRRVSLFFSSSRCTEIVLTIHGDIRVLQMIYRIERPLDFRCSDFRVLVWPDKAGRDFNITEDLI